MTGIRNLRTPRMARCFSLPEKFAFSPEIRNSPQGIDGMMGNSARRPNDNSQFKLNFVASEVGNREFFW